ncbi:MAG: hypothetical protein JWN91_3312 [Nocardioides sp.]|nr:hypothetical protein [Nocardioides sp.]
MADQHEHPEPAYDRWSRPNALSRRGYVLAVLIPLVVAACAFGLVSLIASDDNGISGTTVRLPESGYAPTNAGDGAQIQGVLRLDSDHCVYLEAGQDGADPGRVVAVWPAGYKASREGERLTIYDAQGKVLAHDGDEIRTSGEFADAGTFAGEPCLPETGEVAVIQGSVEIVASAP